MDKKVVLELAIAASPHQVYRALTDPLALTQWFAEHADISLPEQRYAFWGRFTPGTPGRQAGDHQLLLAETDRRLQYRWHFRGQDTLVDFELHAQGAATGLRLTHTGLSAPQPGQFSVADFWDLSLENLRGWLEKQTISPRCDFSDIKQGEIELHVDVEADPAAVFAALISTGQLKRYMGENPTVEPQVGGRYDFGWEGGGPVKIVELVPDKKLAYTWEYPPEPATLVTWTLEGSGGKTQLTIVHSGFTADRSGADYQVGWLHYLARIKFMVETGPGWQKAHIPVGDYELV